MLNGTIATQGVPVALQSGAQPADPGSYIDVLPVRVSTGNLAGRFVATDNAAIVPLGASTATLRISARRRSDRIRHSVRTARFPCARHSQRRPIERDGQRGRTARAWHRGRCQVVWNHWRCRWHRGFRRARINPGIDPAYTMNGCAIGFSCILAISAENLPQVYSVLSDARATSPLSPPVLVAVPQFPVPLGWLSSPDVVPPNIADRTTDVRCTVLALLLLSATHCTTPPPDAYVGAVQIGDGLDVGTTAAGETCRQQTDRAGIAEIYCEDREQPAGSVHRGDPDGARRSRYAGDIGPVAGRDRPALRVRNAGVCFPGLCTVGAVDALHATCRRLPAGRAGRERGRQNLFRRWDPTTAAGAGTIDRRALRSPDARRRAGSATLARNAPAHRASVGAGVHRRRCRGIRPAHGTRRTRQPLRGFCLRRNRLSRRSEAAAEGARSQ